MSIGIASGISLGIVIGSKINRNCLLKKNQLSGITAGAVASIIIFEAERHRKNRIRYNYIQKITAKKNETFTRNFGTLNNKFYIF